MNIEVYSNSCDQLVSVRLDITEDAWFGIDLSRKEAKALVQSLKQAIREAKGD